jgi:hypothetical protein
MCIKHQLYDSFKQCLIKETNVEKKLIALLPGRTINSTGQFTMKNA